MARPTIKERARLFVGKARPSIAGQHGHDALFAVACGLVVGFGLNDVDAWDLLCEYNAANCQPSWSDKDLRRKLEHARRHAERHPDEVGKLADADRSDYTGPRSPANIGTRPSSKPAAKPPPAGAPKPGTPSRTPRTAVFEVRRFGDGVTSRTPRAIRTLPAYSFPKPHSSTSVSKSDKVVSEKSEVLKPAAKPQAAVPIVQSKPAIKYEPARNVRREPAERVDVTTILTNGEVFRNGKFLRRIPAETNQ